MKNYERAAVSELRVFSGISKKSKKILVNKRDFYSLSYRYCGKAQIKSEETEFVSEAGSITFMPKNIAYETQILEDTQITAIHFKLNRDIDFRNPSTISVSDKGISLLFEKLTQGAVPESPVDFSQMAVFYELLSKLEALELMKNNEQIPKKISLARKYMIEKFSDPYFSIDTLADTLSVSGSYLRREFSRAYGKSPISFLRELRTGNAKGLLQSSELSIAEIAEQSGFSSASYFIQVFHKTVGCSPAKYRQETKIIF